jgi:hypothetical protein
MNYSARGEQRLARRVNDGNRAVTRSTGRACPKRLKWFCGLASNVLSSPARITKPETSPYQHHASPEDTTESGDSIESAFTLCIAAEM